MSDKIIFLDSNVLLYGFGNDLPRKSIAKNLIRLKPIISTQVLGEVINVLYKKFALSNLEIRRTYDFILDHMTVQTIAAADIHKAIQLKEKYKYSFWDSQIIASALSSYCSILYSEDMQDGQHVENSLIIINPFKV